MHDDPERLLARSGTDQGQELLRSLRGIDPPPGAQETGWHTLARSIAAAGVVGSLGAASSASKDLVATVTDSAMTSGAATGGAGGTSGALTAGGKLAAVKLLSAVVLAGGTATGVIWSAIGRDTPSTTPAAPTTMSPPERSIEVPPPAVVTVAAAPELAELPKSNSPARRTPAAAHRDEPPEALAPSVTQMPESALTKESALVVAARAKLRQGDTAGASAALHELDQVAPRGKLTQEREILRIELLAAKGDQAGASRRAKAFLAAHPNSPHAARLARFAH